MFKYLEKKNKLLHKIKDLSWNHKKIVKTRFRKKNLKVVLKNLTLVLSYYCFSIMFNQGLYFLILELRV